MAMAWPSNTKTHFRPSSESDRWCLPSIAVKASYVFLHQLDLILTVLAVSLGFSELNPLMRCLLTAPVQLVVIKVFIPLVIVWLTPNKLLIPATAFIALVVVWNVKELLLLLL
ncbi:DUF5658 family protein [Chloroflexota bacterium]